MRVIAVTGGIASGKSSVTRMLEAKGARGIFVDQLYSELIQPGSKLLGEIVKSFGRDILLWDGNLNRRALSRIVFFQPLKLQILNKITHPKIIERLRKDLEAITSEGKDVKIVIDVPLLVESYWVNLVDLILVVYSSKDKQIERLEKKGMSFAEALARLRVQTPWSKLFKYADFIIENNGTIKELEKKVEDFWAKLASEEFEKEVTGFA